MTLEEFQCFIADISYKPGWRLRIRDDLWQCGYVLAVDCEQPDRNSCKPVRLGSQNILYYEAIDRMDKDEVLRWVRHCLHRMETHEADEWLTYRGERPFDPHKDELRG